MDAWTLVIPVAILVVAFWFLRKVVKLGFYLVAAALVVAAWWWFFVR